MKIIGDSMYGNVVQLRIGDICSFGVTGVVVGGGGKIRKVTPMENKLSCSLQEMYKGFDPRWVL